MPTAVTPHIGPGSEYRRSTFRECQMPRVFGSLGDHRPECQSVRSLRPAHRARRIASGESRIVRPRIRPPRGQTLNRQRLRTVPPIHAGRGEDARKVRYGKGIGWGYGGWGRGGGWAHPSAHRAYPHTTRMAGRRAGGGGTREPTTTIFKVHLYISFSLFQFLEKTT